MKVWQLNHNGILDGLGLEVVEDIDSADVVFLWNDVGSLERGLVNWARGKKKRVYVFQHGRKGTSKYYPPFNEEISADKLFVWGEFDKRRLIKSGRDPNKIVVAGTTVFNRLIGRKEHKGTNVVFCPEHWDRPVDENIQVRDELRKLKLNIITKIIESHEPKEFDNPISSNRTDSSHLDVCAGVLSTADVVVGVSESTFELLAQSLDIPVVIMGDWEPKAFGGDTRYAEYERLISNASHQTSVKDLNKTIRHALKHPEELRQERREVAVDEGGYGLDTKEIIKWEI